MVYSVYIYTIIYIHIYFFCPPFCKAFGMTDVTSTLNSQHVSIVLLVVPGVDWTESIPPKPCSGATGGECFVDSSEIRLTTTWDLGCKKTCKEWDEIPTNLNWLDGFLSQLIYLFWDYPQSPPGWQDDMCRRRGIPTINTFIWHCYWSYQERGASQCMPGTSGTVAWPGCFWLEFELLFCFGGSTAPQ